MNTSLAPQITSQRRRFKLLPETIRWNPSWTSVILLFCGAHIPLALLVSYSPYASTAHALITLGIGVWAAVSFNRPERMAYIAAYITGAETLWRMTGALVLWEFGKYSIIGLLIIAILRSGRLKGTFWPLLYFFLLLPSLVIPMMNVDSSVMRDQISFNLSGPLALAISVWFFNGVVLTYSQMHRVFLFLIGPTIGIASIAAFSMLGASKIYFSNNSNFVTSGGFGPNQVSAILALGALFCFLIAMDSSASRRLKVIMFLVLILLAIQSALTFSRGGIYAASGAAVIAVFYLIRAPRTRIKAIIAIIVLMTLTVFVVVPKLDDFTQGILSIRFSNTKLTGRDKLIMADLEAWNENPILGVGPGQAKIFRRSFRIQTAAHTEFSRMLAEHGLFGLVAMMIMLIMSINFVRRAYPGPGKAYSSSLLCWSYLYMITAAMRLVAPSVTFGLAAITVVPDQPENVAELAPAFPNDKA